MLRAIFITLLLLGAASRALGQPSSDSLSARACEKCHAKIYAEWRASRHAGALENRLFLASFRRDPQMWCVSCHGPLPPQEAVLRNTRISEDLAELSERLERTPLAAEGINCIACHLRNGKLLSARRPSAAAKKAHAMQYDPSLYSAEFCGSCHQVNWPRSLTPLIYSAVPMQDTLAEHRAAGSPSGRCQTCHMRDGGHRFPGGHDSDFLRRTISARARRGDGNKVRVELRVQGAGHRVPTGDPFRRLRIEICGDEKCTLPLAAQTLGRFVRDDHGEPRLISDTRLPAPAHARREVEQSILLMLPSENASSLRLRVSYLYVSPSTESDLELAERESVISESAVE